MQVLCTLNIVRPGIRKYLVKENFISASKGILEGPFEDLRQSSTLRKELMQFSIFCKSFHLSDFMGSECTSELLFHESNDIFYQAFPNLGSFEITIFQ